jgi:DMSO reductase family type II enzyme heme b subunit
MKKTSRAIVVFTVLLLVVAALYFVVVYRMTSRVSVPLPTPDTLTVARTSGAITLDPRDPMWDGITATKVHLLPQSVRPPYGKRELDIEVKGTFNDSTIAFRMNFPDATESRSDSLAPDACAIMFTPANGPAATQIMGHDGTANIWHWLANRDFQHYAQGVDSVLAVRELIAAGAGTQNPMDGQNVGGRGVFADGRWTVVFERATAPRQPGELALTPESDEQIAFAVWDGAGHERFGIKSISILRRLRFAGGGRP